MRIAFRAAEASFEIDGDVMSMGVAAADEDDEGAYIRVQRAIDRGEPLADWEEDGLHFEYKDQLYGAYGVLGTCRLGRASLAFDLANPIDDLEGVRGFDVELAIDDDVYQNLRDGLPRLFEGTRVTFNRE